MPLVLRADDQKENRQFVEVRIGRVILDKASQGRTVRNSLSSWVLSAGGNTVICHSMDCLGRNLDDLRRIVLDLNARGIHIRFVSRA